MSFFIFFFSHPGLTLAKNASIIWRDLTLILSREMVAGFDAHADLYPTPLVSTEDLAASIDAYMANKNAELAARASWEKTVNDKNEAL